MITIVILSVALRKHSIISKISGKPFAKFRNYKNAPEAALFPVIKNSTASKLIPQSLCIEMEKVFTSFILNQEREILQFKSKFRFSEASFHLLVCINNSSCSMWRNFLNIFSQHWREHFSKDTERAVAEREEGGKVNINKISFLEYSQLEQNEKYFILVMICSPLQYENVGRCAHEKAEEENKQHIFFFGGRCEKEKHETETKHEPYMSYVCAREIEMWWEHTQPHQRASATRRSEPEVRAASTQHADAVKRLLK